MCRLANAVWFNQRSFFRPSHNQGRKGAGNGTSIFIVKSLLSSKLGLSLQRSDAVTSGHALFFFVRLGNGRCQGIRFIRQSLLSCSKAAKRIGTMMTCSVKSFPVHHPHQGSTNFLRALLRIASPCRVWFLVRLFASNACRDRGDRPCLLWPSPSEWLILLAPNRGRNKTAQTHAANVVR